MKITVIVSVAVAFGVGLAFGYVVKLSRPASEAGALKSELVPGKTSGPAAAEPESTPVEVGKAVLSDDLSGKLAKVVQERSRTRRIGKFYAMMEGITAENAHDIVDALRNLKGIPEKSYLLSLAMQSWATTDPQAAMAYAQAIPKGQDRKQAILGALGGWAEKDLAAAQKWADEQPAGSLKRDALRVIISKVGEDNPDRALALIQADPSKMSGGYAYS
ncbi:MAG: hypothetical protein WCH43_16425, partial [Verrucomicrobiota bacterium]